MKVENSVNAVFSANVDNAVEVLEAGLLEDPWVHVVFEMPVIEGDTDAVQSKRFEELGIVFLEEIFEELAKISVDLKVCGAQGPHTLSKNSSDFSFPTTFANSSRIWNSQPGYPFSTSVIRYDSEDLR